MPSSFITVIPISIIVKAKGFDNVMWNWVIPLLASLVVSSLIALIITYIRCIKSVPKYNQIKTEFMVTNTVYIAIISAFILAIFSGGGSGIHAIIIMPFTSIPSFIVTTIVNKLIQNKLNK